MSKLELFARQVDVQYRHVELAVDSGSLSGFALWYATQWEAYAFFDAIEEYFESKDSDKQVCLAFSSSVQGGSFALCLDVDTGSRLLSTVIHGIQASYILKLKDSLARYPYLFVLAGFTDDTGRDQFVPDCSYSPSRIIVDGEMISGNSQRKFPQELLSQLVSKAS